MTPSSLTPAPILELVTGLWAAGVLKGGLDLHVFDHLGAGPQGVESLSSALGAESSSLHILLDALVAVGLLKPTPKGYALTDVSAEFLVSTKPAYLGGILTDTTISSTIFDLYKDYRRVVIEGYHVNPWEYGEGSNDRIVRLTRALFTLGSPTAHALADHMGWTASGHPGALRLLDVGCGSAVYGLVALSRLPNARLTAQDWPVILPVAQAFAAQLGVAERVDMLAGDLRTVEFGGPYDAVFLGHILHNYAEETCREIVRKCMSIVAPGGVVAIIEFLAERGQPDSTFSWLFSTMIRGTTTGGRSFSASELQQMLAEAGAQRTEVGGGLPVGFVLGYHS
jgi:2-polyprenyl-3-methyl-5-hydroxy-6-metoxy-1,4-benzoquinol methylase